ncbi:MGMT family protein [Tomitella fengzijianii]|uniref:DNA methyltransferase n=1 Tax=Tomitella fengzijianii TaxID=2597660 RepID=A0A516X671_9ACTN|nr:MGMT family protein [Tomitella fengzijianii]QDQ98171.1 DNA methyltransferase [Tomitella fengzijianii]
MAATTEMQVERVRELIAAIPHGRVSTYGAIAGAAGLSTPRTVAWILRVDGGGLPWQRVIRADGRPAPAVRTRQLALLAEEGVPITDGRVDMRHAFHEP